jgi:hypothetical protein
LKKILAAALLILLSVNASASDKSKQYISKIKGQIVISADGVVKSVDLTDLNNDGLKNFLISKIKTWEFYPLLFNGQPLEAKTGFTFDLLTAFDAQNKLEGFAFLDVNVEPTELERTIQKQSGAPGKRNPPLYPVFALRQGVEARVVVAVQIMPEGRVAKAGVYELALLSAGHRVTSQAKSFALNNFGSSAVHGIESWQWMPWELEANNCLKGCIGHITVDYEISPGKTWRTYAKIDTAPLPWASGAEVASMDDKAQSEWVRFKSKPNETEIKVDASP